MSDIGRKIFTIQSSLRKWLNKIFNDFSKVEKPLREVFYKISHMHMQKKEEKLLPMKSCKSFQNI